MTGHRNVASSGRESDQPIDPVIITLEKKSRAICDPAVQSLINEQFPL
jgi:hypothetical protein